MGGRRGSVMSAVPAPRPHTWLHAASPLCPAPGPLAQQRSTAQRGTAQRGAHLLPQAGQREAVKVLEERDAPPHARRVVEHHLRSAGAAGAARPARRAQRIRPQRIRRTE